MKYELGRDTTVIGVELEEGRSVIITRPCIMGGVATHTIDSRYNETQITHWLRNRMMRNVQPMVQDAFPDMKAEDREFLMTGITPAKWNEMFPKEEGQD